MSNARKSNSAAPLKSKSPLPKTTQKVQMPKPCVLCQRTARLGKNLCGPCSSGGLHLGNSTPRPQSTNQQQLRPLTRPELEKQISVFNAENQGKVTLKLATTPVVNASNSARSFNIGHEKMRSNWSEHHNSYLASLKDPLMNPGARIPDDSTLLETTTLQVIYHSQITPGGNGFCGIMMGGNTMTGILATNCGPFMVPQSALQCNLNGAALSGATHLETSTTASTLNNLFPDSTTAPNGCIPVAIPNVAGFLNSYAAKARVVSSSMSMRPTGNFTNTQGFFIAASVPTRFFGSTLTFSKDTLQNLPGALTLPIPANLSGVSTIHSPMDQRNYAFADMGMTAPPADLEDSNYYSLNPSIQIICAFGQPASSPPTFLYDICLNYEIIILSGNIAFGARPSYSDPLALAMAKNEMANSEFVSRGSAFDGTATDYEQLFSHPSLSKRSMSVSKLQVFASRPGSGTDPGFKVHDAPCKNFYEFATLNLHAGPVRIKTVKKVEKDAFGNSHNRNVPVSAETKSETPIIESVIDNLASIAKTVAPSLLKMIGFL